MRFGRLLMVFVLAVLLAARFATAFAQPKEKGSGGKAFDGVLIVEPELI